MASNQQYWVLQPIDDADTSEFSLLDLEPKTELDLMVFGIPGSDSSVGSGGGPIARSAEGVATNSGDGGGTSNVLGGANSLDSMSYSVSSSNPNLSLLSSTLSTSLYDTQLLSDQKPQIRHDCMWAGMCADQSHPEKHSGGCGGCAQRKQQQQQHLLQHQQQSSVGSTIGNLALLPSKDIHKLAPSGEQPTETALTAKSGPPASSSSSVLVNRTTAASNEFSAFSRKYACSRASLLAAPFKATQGAARIPAGSSLLIKRQQQQQLSSGMTAQNCRQLPTSPPTSSSSESGVSSGEGGSEANEQSLRMVRVPHLPRGSFLASREQEARSIAAQNHARPDTPLSLDDDPLEFKHNLDLVATCTIGSNQQSLLHAASSLPSASCSSSSSSNTTTTSSSTATSYPSATSVSSVSQTPGVESLTFYGRLGGSCSCGGINNSNSISSIGHTAQCYFNYLQDTSIDDDMRIKQLREQLLMLDDPCVVPPNHHHHYHHHHNHHPHLGHHHAYQFRPDSPNVDSQLEQLLNDLREIDEGSSCLLDDQQHTTAPASHSVGMKDGPPLAPSSSASLHPQPHHHQQRSSLTLAPCGGELSGVAHATCNKECYYNGSSSSSSLELPHHLASPSGERRRRHQFAHRRRSITGRGWMSDDDDDEEEEEEDLLKQLEEDDDFYEKHFEQNSADVVAACNTVINGYTNTSSWEDEEEEDDEEEEEEEDEEESGEDEDKDEQEEEEEADEEEEEESMYGDGSSSRSRSRIRTPRHRYHNQYSHQRRVARSYRPYNVEVYRSNGKNQKKQSTGSMLTNGGVNTIIAGSGASLKSSMLGSKLSSTTSGNSSSPTNGSISNSAVTSAAQQPSNGGSGANTYQATHFGDHSYTRPKGGYNMNELGVQTPSDSDEEIDVVSVGDKNLPTNPTERDMRHMQSEVANKIRTASSRTAGNGALPYGAGSSHHHHHYQRQHHLGDGQRLHHHLGGIYPTPAGSTTISGANTPLPTRSGGASVASSPPPACSIPSTTTGLLHTSSGTSSSSGPSRKRPVGGSSKRSSNASKRMRLGHSKRGGGDGSNGGRHDTAAAQALADELDTVEKRNLHNNLERQRRIGLKNLFEELKRQIPQLRDKDRAPKVNILREAATLCTRLSQEAEQVNELRQQQMKLYERVRYLRSTVHSQQRLGV
ncbi:uncharacterized protein LOC126567424 [Anopheles maculipalpis]|uniref:uncharacterized protein LOC126567424 n=1 Tax=Anopheles maculipalpis TaxID=1496333 RepID=UPI0021598606|nr:uncharacterized protein LOC126567424 [Anopheles maculipalpis]